MNELITCELSKWQSQLCLPAGEPAVIIKGEFTWDLAAPATLMDTDVTVPAGSFVAIVGPTGDSDLICSRMI